mgnify:CR=1 FL=1
MDKIYKTIAVRNQSGQFNSSTSFLKGTAKILKSAKNLLPNALIFKGSVGQICFKIENSCPSDVINKFPSLKIEVEKSILFDYNFNSYTFNLLDVYANI